MPFTLSSPVLYSAMFDFIKTQLCGLVQAAVSYSEEFLSF